MMDVILSTYQGAILGPIARLLGHILEALYQILSLVGIENTGVCIILFTFIINALMIPIQIKQQRFAKMSAIMNPELMAIQEKYKDKKDQASQQKMSLETQAVYQKYGVSPASGCLPMLISLPILFALYRVIYNIPAYVPHLYDIYEKLAQSLQNAGITIETLAGKDYIKSPTYVVNQAINNAAKDTGNLINYYIDVLSQYNSAAWDKLAKNYSDYATIIRDTASQANSINSFLGMNIADTPSIRSVSVTIPIASIITQYISTKLAMIGNPQPQNNNNSASTTAQSMKTMNTVMPFVTGFMCLYFPIGVGIYWIAGNVFRIIQSLCINFYFSKIDMDEEIKKNVEKAKKRYEKLGMDPSTLDRAAKQRTSTIDANKNSSEKKANNKSGNGKSVNQIARKTSSAEVKRKGNKKYKEGSVAAYANMLRRDDQDD